MLFKKKKNNDLKPNTNENKKRMWGILPAIFYVIGKTICFGGVFGGILYCGKNKRMAGTRTTKRKTRYKNRQKTRGKWGKRLHAMGFFAAWRGNKPFWEIKKNDDLGGWRCFLTIGAGNKTGWVRSRRMCFVKKRDGKAELWRTTGMLEVGGKRDCPFCRETIFLGEQKRKKQQKQKTRTPKKKNGCCLWMLEMGWSGEKGGKKKKNRGGMARAPMLAWGCRFNGTKTKRMGKRGKKKKKGGERCLRMCLGGEGIRSDD